MPKTTPTYRVTVSVCVPVSLTLTIQRDEHDPDIAQIIAVDGPMYAPSLTTVRECLDEETLTYIDKQLAALALEDAR